MGLVPLASNPEERLEAPSQVAGMVCVSTLVLDIVPPDVESSSSCLRLEPQRPGHTRAETSG